MRTYISAAMLVVLMLFSAAARADESPAFEHQLRKLLRSEQIRHRGERPQPQAASFAGWWSGRFSYIRSSSTCSTSVTSILFQHQVAIRGTRAALATNHAGSFLGSSRDGGRSYQFIKPVETSSGTFLVGVAYGYLSSGGRSAVIAHLVEHLPTGCRFAYGAAARR